MTVSDQNHLEKYVQDALKDSYNPTNINKAAMDIKIKSIGIIGAGTMGGGIAMNFANIGIPVKLIETNSNHLQKGIEQIHFNYQRSADRGRFPQQEVTERMSRITGSVSIEDLRDCDLIIEAVFEDIEIKKGIFLKLNKIAKLDCIVASNTSGLDINEIAGVTDRPGNVIGLHFFSPANVMKLVEVVQGKLTNPKVVQRCMELAKKIGKIPVLVGVCEGFVGNRILWVRQMQAIRLLKVGVTPWDIDKALNQFGFKMGPFQMSDLAGLDLGWSKGLKTNNPIKDALCEAGRRGQKTSKGYYDYDSNRNASPSEETEKIIKGITKVKKVTMSPEEIIETCIYPMINEAVKILDENKIQRPSDIDVVWLFGYGWPKDKGGPMFYGDKIGSQKVLKKLEELSLVDSSISISKLLYETASNGADFLKIETGGLIPT